MPGTTTVLWHSVMWQYMSPADREAVSIRIDGLGASATEAAPFAHLFMEPARRSPEPGPKNRSTSPFRYPSPGSPEFLVVLQMWPDGDWWVLGRSTPHGLPTTWE